MTDAGDRGTFDGNAEQTAAKDNGEPGRLTDRYGIRLNTGYDSGDQLLRGGNIQIR